MFTIRSVDETGSTNDDAQALLGNPQYAGTVVVADYQRAGRGRHARAWIAPAGTALLFTAILPQAIASDALWAVPFWTALAVADGIARATGIRVALKWPNDLLLGAAKVCGILCVSRIAGARAHVGCGVGINVRRPTQAADRDALAAIVPPPAFLSDACATADRDRTLTAILTAFEMRLGQFSDPRAIARAWESRADLDGTPYTLLIDGEDEPLEAIARAIGDDGSLLVTTRHGATRRIALADARVRR